MGEISKTNYAITDPAVVIDKVDMTYRVPTDDDTIASRGSFSKRFFGKIISRQPIVEVHALKNISLIVEKGESVGIVGRNGSGKSTLMKLINGRIPPTSGSIYASSRPTLLGVSAALVPDLSGEQNIMLGCLAMGLSRSEIREKYADIVEVSGLETSIHLPMRTYSSGMGARLQFAIATAVDTEILLIDEALNTGDDQFRARTKRKMDELRSQAGCVFLVSHSTDTIRQMCSRVVWIDDGELIADGDPAYVTRWYKNYVRQLSDGDRAGARKTKHRLLSGLTVADVVNRQSGRRKVRP